MTQTASGDWLSIRQASRLLGVHISTLREWADTGILPSYRTPGGHRRFSATDLHNFTQQHRSRRDKNSSTEHAIDIVRQELQMYALNHSVWFQQIGVMPKAAQRAHQRDIGQRLLACVVAFVEDTDHRAVYLDEGRSIAREYGKLLSTNGLSAGNAARATIHFRQLILKAVLEVQLGARTKDEEDAQLFQRVSAFLDDILLTLLDAYP